MIIPQTSGNNIELVLEGKRNLQFHGKVEKASLISQDTSYRIWTSFFCYMHIRVPKRGILHSLAQIVKAKGHQSCHLFLQV